MLNAGGMGLPTTRISTPPSPPASVEDRGSFAVFFAGHPLGTENFSIRFSANKIETTAETQLKVEQGGQSVELNAASQLVLSPQLEPQSYELNQKGSQAFHLSVDFRSSPAKSRLRLANSKEDEVRDFALPKDVVVLDDNVICHYQLLVDRLALKPEKKQSFTAYVPQEALPGVLAVEDMGMQPVEFDGRKETLRRWSLSTENARIDLWVDNEQHLQRIYNSAAQLEAVRKK